MRDKEIENNPLGKARKNSCRPRDVRRARSSDADDEGGEGWQKIGVDANDNLQAKRR